MKDVAALHSCIIALERYSRQSTIHHALNRKLVVKRLAPELVDVTLPTTETCSALLNKIFSEAEYYESDTRTIINAIVHKTGEDHPAGTKRHSVHPECRILEYFSTQPFKSPPLSHIGLSKGSCVACFSIFQAWNTISPYTTYTCCRWRAKWCPWVFPSGLKASGQDTDTSGSLVDMTYKRITDQILSRMGRFLYLLGSLAQPSNADDETNTDTHPPDI
jgi:hypothetical protein